MAWNYSPKEFIKVYRKFMEWEWYTDVNTKTLFLHCLLRANWKAGSWKGINYRPGEFITSLPSLAEESGLSVQQVRTSLEKLISTGEITSKTTDSVTGRKLTRNRIITVNNWDEYQVDNSQISSQNNRQVNRQKDSKKPTGKSTGKLTGEPTGKKNAESPENIGLASTQKENATGEPTGKSTGFSTGEQQDSNSRYKKYRSIEDNKENNNMPAAPFSLEPTTEELRAMGYEGRGDEQ